VKANLIPLLLLQQATKWALLRQSILKRKKPGNLLLAATNNNKSNPAKKHAYQTESSSIKIQGIYAKYP
jgi:hypothetical protein